MSRSSRHRIGSIAVAATVSGLLLTGCASGTAGSHSGGATDPSTVGIVGDQADGGQPVSGGTLRFASYSPVASLDPTKTQPAGTTGGTEMAAVYDVLLRYDAQTETYHPQLAKSLTESGDHLVWTLKLRDDVTFSDGTPLDADAVVASTSRFNELRGPNNEVFQAGVQSVEATDRSTVVYTLNQPWTEFPAMLTFGHGMIVGAAADAGEQFTPIGAGAFTLENLVPGELSLKARSDYWNGAPHLDGLKFVTIKDEQPKIDALKSGGIQMAFLRNAATVNSARTQFPGYIETLSMADLGQINSREGRPGSDVRLRKAIQLSIDPEVLNQRAKEGQGMPGTLLFQEWSKWHDATTPAVNLDLEQAKALVAEAKSDGFDGKLNYVSVQDQASQQQALAVQSMLGAVGLEVTIDYSPTVTDMVKKLYVDHDFDIGYGALSISDAAPFLRFYSALNSTSSNNVGGYKDAGLDALLANVQSATDDDAKREAIADLQVELTEKAPLLAYGAGPNFVAWTDNVHGMVPTMDCMILFEKAWIS
ncbi:ABC transporter substrate-binding protein [Tomitella biformata]|uniref:ABC transporter substrate-binding protein n=1 Tax=Tomitella biformata TaxID=630403 RepID=UPI000464BA7B|nr:ABC transporter substrate-binding protein [Tomitella biformata]